ncbi:MAG: GntR family transcriptional regulator [Gammaproteobacteria bacterium]
MNKIVSMIAVQKPEGGNETLASTVYQQLRADILSGKLQPGTKLRLHELKNHYDAGNSPIREALNRLLVNGMVVREENRGFHVSPAGIPELLELIRTRCWLEEVALRESIKHGDSSWEERIVLAYYWLSRVTRSKDDPAAYTSTEWEDKHREFHLSLLSACNSNILLGFCAQLFELTLRYRNLAAVVEYRERHELDEHRALYGSVLDRDADEAVKLLVAHYQVTADIVLSSGSLK